MSAMGIKNIDAELHVRGESQFLDDLPVPEGTLYAAVFSSPVAHGDITRLDITAAERMEGIHGTFTAEDIPGENQIGNIIPDEPYHPGRALVGDGGGGLRGTTHRHRGGRERRDCPRGNAGDNHGIPGTSRYFRPPRGPCTGATDCAPRYFLAGKPRRGLEKMPHGGGGHGGIRGPETSLSGDTGGAGLSHRKW